MVPSRSQWASAGWTMVVMQRGEALRWRKFEGGMSALRWAEVRLEFAGAVSVIELHWYKSAIAYICKIFPSVVPLLRSPQRSILDLLNNAEPVLRAHRGFDGSRRRRCICRTRLPETNGCHSEEHG